MIDPEGFERQALLERMKASLAEAKKMTPQEARKRLDEETERNDRQCFDETAMGEIERLEQARAAHGHCIFFRGVRVICGVCGKKADFCKAVSAGGDYEARQAGWLIKWPEPIVRCPTCKGVSNG